MDSVLFLRQFLKFKTSKAKVPNSPLITPKVMESFILGIDLAILVICSIYLAKINHASPYDRSVAPKKAVNLSKVILS